MRLPPQSPPSKPIDVLILDILALGKIVTPAEIAATWGEDRARVHERLERFRRVGLCNLRVRKGRSLLDRVAYLGNAEPIAEYLAAEDKRSHLKKHG